MDEVPRYWFRAKRYGWGWGLPAAWQGWAVLALFVVLVATGPYLFPPEEHVGYFLGYTLLIALALLAVCWIKGEPPRWRWGGK